MLKDKAAVQAANTRAVLGVFEKYQKDRLQFVQTVADLASRESNIEALQAGGVMHLLGPLLQDNVPAIQQAAALALGRLANFHQDLAQSIVDSDVLTQLVYSLAEQNRFYKKAAAFVLRAVAKHSPKLAQAVVDCGALSALVTCLEEFDPGVKESSAWALGYIARHNADLAQSIVDAGALPLLVLCVQEPELSLKRISASALSDISKHSAELAQSVVDAHSIQFLVPLLKSNDAKLKRQICSALAQISKHSVDLAETVIEGDVFPSIIKCLKDEDGYVKKNAATLICEIAKHSAELAQLIVNTGGIAAVVDYVLESQGNARLPAIMTLGYIAAFTETLALTIIVAKGVSPLLMALEEESEDHLKAACAWALGQIGRHSPDHAKALADKEALPKLLKIFISCNKESEQDLKTKTKRALKSILEKTLQMESLEPMLNMNTPLNIIKYVIGQFSKILPHDVAARREFVTSGCLQRLQLIASNFGTEQERTMPVSTIPTSLVGTKMGEYIRVINECYPEEIVRYYSPGYSSTLLDKIDQYNEHQEDAPLIPQKSNISLNKSLTQLVPEQQQQEQTAIAL